MGDQSAWKKQLLQDRAARMQELLLEVDGLQPNPCELHGEIPLEYVDQYRYLECKNYDNCIQIAGMLRWRGFSCRACTIHKNIMVQQKYMPKLRKAQEDEERPNTKNKNDSK